MPQTKTSLCNLAYEHLGGAAPFITDIATDTTKHGKLFQECIENSRKAVLRSHPWNFAIARAKLELKAITNAVSNGGPNLIRLTATAHGRTTGDYVTVEQVQGTTEANGQWTVTVIDANTLDLVGSTFTNTYVSGGLVGLSAIWEYRFKHVLPSNFVRLVSILDDPEHEVEGAFIVSNDTTLYIKYVYDPFPTTTADYSSADPQFFQALALHIAWASCYALTQSNKLKAEIWEYFTNLIARARHVDSTESSRKQFTADEWDLAHAGYAARPDRNYRDP